jgi:hypothetical protein
MTKLLETAFLGRDVPLDQSPVKADKDQKRRGTGTSQARDDLLAAMRGTLASKRCN